MIGNVETKNENLEVNDFEDVEKEDPKEVFTKPKRNKKARMNKVKVWKNVTGNLCCKPCSEH